MKFFLIFFASLTIIACNNEKPGELPAQTEAKANVPSNMYGFKPEYSFSFVMDSAKNSETILALWKDWKDGDLSKSRAHFADSVSLFLADGSSMIGLTDTIMIGMQNYRSSFKGMDVKVDALFAVKSTDKNESWVTVWGTEIQTDMKGKVDSVSLQETWRFNKAGKIDMMFQASRKGILPPPPTN